MSDSLQQTEREDAPIGVVCMLRTDSRHYCILRTDDNHYRIVRDDEAEWTAERLWSTARNTNTKYFGSVRDAMREFREHIPQDTAADQ